MDVLSYELWSIRLVVVIACFHSSAAQGPYCTSLSEGAPFLPLLCTADAFRNPASLCISCCVSQRDIGPVLDFRYKAPNSSATEDGWEPRRCAGDFSKRHGQPAHAGDRVLIGRYLKLFGSALLTELRLDFGH